MKNLLLPLLLLFSGVCAAQELPSGEPMEALQELRETRNQFMQSPQAGTSAGIRQMIALGLWSNAAMRLVRLGIPDTPEALLAWIDWSMANHQYAQAEGYLAHYESLLPGTLDGMVIRAQLYHQAWLLPAAAAQADRAIAEYPDSPGGYVTKAAVLISQQQYDSALAVAKQVQARFPDSGKGWLLAAEVFFWKRNNPQAGEALAVSLQKDPLDADARFWYGYYLWRKGDATLLPEMTWHWEVALAVNPLHYFTHWHWGNGHTAFTFVDYAEPDEEVIRQDLAEAERMVAHDSLGLALELIRGISENHFSSAIPDLALGSVYYLAEEMPRETRLDSALAAFQRSLKRKPHFGPAHNGVAAVIKQRQFSYLDAFDSLENAIHAVQIPADAAFDEVFSDLSAFPGTRARNMVWNQLYTAKAYLPLLSRMGESFHILPLHQDLALVMGDPYFREAVTFDNRQWMDIRGVGSGATGIEYVERGAHLERNVTLHEYMHLIHGSLLTDREVRRISSLYFQAMKEGRTLDYYAESNDFEYFAQAYPAYFSQIKVHPLNHKSLNTRADLLRKDPQMYAFVDSLVKKETAALGGDLAPMKANRAQLYVRLAETSLRQGEDNRAGLLLDTALVWQPGYLPAWVGKTQVALAKHNWTDARAWMEKAKKAFPDSPETLALQAEVDESLFFAGELAAIEARTSIQSNLEKAFEAEKDPQRKADYAALLWSSYQRFAQIEKAQAFAESFALSSPSVSSQLRRMILMAQATAAEEQGSMGYLDEARQFFEAAITQNPQEQYLRMAWSRVLAENGQPAEAYDVLQSAEALFAASGRLRGDMAALMVWELLMQGKVSEARKLLEPMRDGAFARTGDPFVWVRIYLTLDDLSMANKLLAAEAAVKYPRQRAEYFYHKGLLLQSTGDVYGAMNAWSAALEENAYHLSTRLALLGELKTLNDQKSVKKIAGKGLMLPLPPGPAPEMELQLFERWANEKP